MTKNSEERAKEGRNEKNKVKEKKEDSWCKEREREREKIARLSEARERVKRGVGGSSRRGRGWGKGA